MRVVVMEFRSCMCLWFEINESEVSKHKKGLRVTTKEKNTHVRNILACRVINTRKVVILREFTNVAHKNKKGGCVDKTRNQKSAP